MRIKRERRNQKQFRKRPRLKRTKLNQLKNPSRALLIVQLSQKNQVHPNRL